MRISDWSSDVCSSDLPDDLAALVARYDIGTVVSCKGIAEGVENSNFLLETTGGRFILTLYEKRVSENDLPFFVDLLDHLASRNCPVPAMIRDREGVAIQQVSGRSACVIQFLQGISLTQPTPAQCEARSEEHTSELQSLMRISYAVFCLKKKNNLITTLYLF